MNPSIHECSIQFKSLLTALEIGTCKVLIVPNLYVKIILLTNVRSLKHYLGRKIEEGSF